MTTPRIFIWSQHLLGTGHLVRSLRIAGAIAARGMRVSLASGGPHLPAEAPDGVDLHQLAELRTADTGFSGLIDRAGDPADEGVWKERLRQMETILSEHPADIVITEMFPFGRRAFRSEIRNLIGLAREANPAVRMVSSVRDILVSKETPEHYRWSIDWIDEFYSKVLVHGDPALIAFAESFPFAQEIGDRLVHTGYIADIPPPPPADMREGVVVSAGGGAVGRGLLEAVMNLLRHAPPGHGPWTLIGGSRMDRAVLEQWRGLAPVGVSIEGHVTDLPHRIARARLAISQAGYNTVAETLALGTPVLLVPFETQSEDEQLRRARAVERAGRGVVLREGTLNRTTLADAVERTIAPGSIPPALDVDGAERTARLIGDLASR